MNKFLLIFLALIFGYGCVHVVRVDPVRSSLYSAGIGEKKSAFVGDPVFYHIDGLSLPGFVARTPYNNGEKEKYDNSLEPKIDIPTNSEWPVIGKDDNGDFLCTNSISRICLFITHDIENKYRAFAWTYCDRVMISSHVRSYALKVPTAAIFEKVDRIYQPGAGYFRRELLYNGKAGNTIKLSYREYKNDIARAAFTQDLIYDLTESKIIGFQDMHIEVLNATNTDINFIIRSLLH